MPSVAAPPRQLPTAEDLERLKKERNWLVQGMKEQEDARRSSANTRQDLDKSQSIIDMVLDRKNKGFARPAPTKPSTGRADSASSPDALPTFRPAISSYSFDSLPSTQTTIETPGSSDASAILARERILATQQQTAAAASPSYQPMQDPLVNPFANLPIPEGALPAPRRSDPMLQFNNTNNPLASSTAFSSASNPVAPPSPNSGLIMTPDNGAPSATIQQPYDYLRAQEEQRRRQMQQPGNRPTVQNLRSPIPDPAEARLF